jgi:hypothetical protein
MGYKLGTILKKITALTMIFSCSFAHADTSAENEKNYLPKIYLQYLNYYQLMKKQQYIQLMQMKKVFLIGPQEQKNPPGTIYEYIKLHQEEISTFLKYLIKITK